MKDQEFKEIGKQVFDVAKKAVSEVVDFVSQQATDNELCQRVVEGAAEMAGKRASVPIRIYESESGFLVEAEVPGCLIEDVDVVVSEESLTLRVQRKADDVNKGRLLKDEFRKPDLERVVKLPVRVNPERVNASISRGILRLELFLSSGRTVVISDEEE